MILIAVVVIVAAGLIGWRLGARNTTITTASSAGSNTVPASTGVKSLISYTLPSGWTDGVCPSTGDTIFVIPSTATAPNCNTNPAAPITIATDPQSHTDCNQLNTASDVKKHTCISLYIDGHKSLKSLTQTGSSTMLDYFINTGKGVVKLEHNYTGSATYQADFDQLVNNVKVRS
ncbi:MAG: hypothetical protein JWS12_294 [Candidatus Saccharibacteria bacterium]|nr:hypothetical protein [Candidatus Saccharibacteria bacterium]